MQGPPADELRPGEVRRRRWQRRVGRGPQQGASSPICPPLPTATRLLSLMPASPPSPTHSQERFQREGAKSLIWNQHSLEVSSN